MKLLSKLAVLKSPETMMPDFKWKSAINKFIMKHEGK